MTMTFDAQVNTLRVALSVYYAPLKFTQVIQEDSPWVLLDFERTQAHDATEPHEWKFALWATTNRIYPVNSDGSIWEDYIVSLGQGQFKEFADRYQWTPLVPVHLSKE